MRSGLRRPVDIVVPIFNARRDVTLCIESVLRHATGDYVLVLVNDCSTDLELVEHLETVAQAEPKVRLINAKKNGGFVQTANLGMRHSLTEAKRLGKRRDVLLLNSDTICTPSFLTLLQDCVYADKTTGIVTPFSNNATICSIPKFCSDNPLPTDMSVDEYAETITASSLKRRPEIVTGVGFCMYVRSEVMEKVGLFDSIYGRGFGEENDFCEQAKRAGFTIRLCDDVFVAHTGKASFGDEGRMLEHKNMKVLLSRFPSYLDEVSYFCETNPLAEVQANAVYFSKRKRSLNRPAVLHVLHSTPFHQGAGGSEHYAADLLRGMKAPRAIVAYPVSDGLYFSEVLDGNFDEPLHHWFPVKNRPEKISYANEEVEKILERAIGLFGITAAHIHHLFSWPVSIAKVLQRAGVPYVAMLHDYLSVCPSHNLFDYSKMSCCPCALGEETTRCCLEAYSNASHTALPGTDVATVVRHRAAFGEMLANAAAVIAPSKKALELVQERAGVSFAGLVIPHGYDSEARLPKAASSSRATLRIAVLGNVNYPNKGRSQYLEVVRGTRDANVEWHFFGDLTAFGYEEELRRAGKTERLHFHGAYGRRDIVGLLSEKDIDLAVLLPACHETFSFTLSEALIAGVPVLALAMGSLVERLEEAGLSASLCQSTAQVIERILYFTSCRPELAQLAEKLRGFRHTTTEECARAVLKCYEQVGIRPFAEVPVLSTATQRESFVAHFQALRPPSQAPVPVLSLEELTPKWWQPITRRLGRVVRRVDDALKEQYLRQRIRIIQSFPFRTLAKLCALSPDTELLSEQGQFAVFRATGRDPFLILPERRVASGDVNCLRLRIRCEIPQFARAQLFWVHQLGEAFSEEKSLKIPLRRTSAWQDLLLDLRAWQAKDRWTAGPEVVMLRLDPMDCEGVFELQELTLAKFAS